MATDKCTATDSNPFGTLIGRINSSSYQDAPLHYLVAKGKDAELCYVHGRDLDPEQDPQYWLIEKAAKGFRRTILGRTGLVQTVDTLDKDGCARKLLHRSNGYGNFEVCEDNTAENILNHAYSMIAGLDFSADHRRRRELFSWRAQQIIARFGELKQLYGHGDIVPEYNDTMIVAKVSESCPRHCLYCPEPSEKGMLLFDKKLISSNITTSKRLHEKYHGQWISEMDEGFLNTSDILWFYLAKRYAGDSEWKKSIEKTDPALARMMLRVNLIDSSGSITSLDDIAEGRSKKQVPDPIEIIDLFSERFPHTSKRYSFMGVPTINATPVEYLKELFNDAQKLNRVLVGIESADDVTSRFLGKNETAEDKSRAIRKLQDAGYKVKVIVQAGMTGEGFFYSNGRKGYRNSRTALKKTADWLSQVMRPAGSGKSDKVLISRYTPVEGTPLAKAHENARIIKPYRSSRSIDKEIAWLVEELRKKRIEAEADYEIAIQDRR